MHLDIDQENTCSKEKQMYQKAKNNNALIAEFKKHDSVFPRVRAYVCVFAGGGGGVASVQEREREREI